MMSSSSAGEQLALSSDCPTADQSQSAEALEKHYYVQLNTLWYLFLGLVTGVGLLVSLVSNMIIIYLFTR